MVTTKYKSIFIHIYIYIQQNNKLVSKYTTGEHQLTTEENFKTR